MGAKYFGAAVKRREDPRFLRGEARYVDDVTLAGMLHAAFLRSPHAHARIARITTERAAALCGVTRVFPSAVGGARRWTLCGDRARRVGKISARVVAESRPRAEAALELIEVEWEPL